MSTTGGLAVAKGTTLCGRRALDIEQILQNLNPILIQGHALISIRDCVAALDAAAISDLMIGLFCAAQTGTGFMEESAHIVVCDDEPDIRDTLSEYLERRGYQVSCAHARGCKDRV